MEPKSKKEYGDCPKSQVPKCCQHNRKVCRYHRQRLHMNLIIDLLPNITVRYTKISFNIVVPSVHAYHRQWQSDGSTCLYCVVLLLCHLYLVDDVTKVVTSWKEVNNFWPCEHVIVTEKYDIAGTGKGTFFKAELHSYGHIA